MKIKNVIFSILIIFLHAYLFSGMSIKTNLRAAIDLNIFNPNDKYSKVSKFINETLTKDIKFKHHAFDMTAYLVDTFGPRLQGSENLELAIEYMQQLLIMEGFENVRMEKVEFKNRWVRGEEYLILLSPRPGKTKIPMVGLGKTNGGNVTAEIVIAKNFTELDIKGQKGLLKGKILFLNPKWTNYIETKKYRKHGPSIASKYGAIGLVLRSVTPHSQETPHTGGISLDDSDKYPLIPAAAISIETADMFERMLKRGQTVTLNLYMEAHFEVGNFTSHNLIGELTGSTYKDEIIVVGGHMDSWDVGPQTGALDDAAGVMVCFEAVRLLIQNGIKPLRTIRFVAWTGEEFGKGDSRGSDLYLKNHENEMEKHIVAFESDNGTSDVEGFGFTGGIKGYNLVKMLSSVFLKDMNAGLLTSNDGYSSDINPLYRAHKIPIMRTLNKDTANQDNYFTYYHSAADSMNVLNPDDLDRNIAAISIMFYMIADIPLRLPKD